MYMCSRWTLLAAQLLCEAQSFREAAVIYQQLGGHQEAAQALIMAGDLLPAGTCYEEGAKRYLSQAAAEMEGEGQLLEGRLGASRADVAAAIQQKHVQQVTELVAKADRCRVEALRCYLEAAAGADESGAPGGAEEGKQGVNRAQGVVNPGAAEVVRLLLDEPDVVEGLLLVRSMKELEVLAAGEGGGPAEGGAAAAAEPAGVREEGVRGGQGLTRWEEGLGTRVDQVRGRVQFLEFDQVGGRG